MVDLKDSIDDGGDGVDQKSQAEIRFSMHSKDGTGIAEESIEEFEGPRESAEDVDGVLHGRFRIEGFNEVDIERGSREGLSKAYREIGQRDGDVVGVVEITGVHEMRGHFLAS